MPADTPCPTRLATPTIGSPCSYEMTGDHIIARLFGFIPIKKIHLGAVNYLRLATAREASPAYYLLNWPSFLLPRNRAARPVYILRTRKGRKVFLQLEGGAHFQLRQAIGRHAPDARARHLAA